MPALTWSPKAMLGALGGRWEKMKQGRLTEDRTAGSLALGVGVGGWAQECGLRHPVAEGPVKEESTEVRTGALGLAHTSSPVTLPVPGQQTGLPIS